MKLAWSFAPDFWASKTTHTALVAIAGAAVALAGHQISAAQFGFALFGALQTAFLRDAAVKAIGSK